MSKTVVGLFNSTAEAQQVKQSLVSNGFDASDIKIVANDHDEDSSSSSTMSREGSRGTEYGRDGEDIGLDAGLQSSSRTNATSYDAGTSTGSGVGSAAKRTAGAAEGAAEGIGEKIGNFFRSLTGGDDEAHGHYASGVNQGGALLTVRADDDEANEVASLLRQHGAREIQGGNEQATGSSTPGYLGNTASGVGNTATGLGSTGSRTDSDTARNLTGEKAIPVVEEELVVGKREVDRGGVRIYSHVVERPAEADVTLRDERINVERRPVNREATAADFEAGKDASFELRATGEEAVVGKNSRVVEEVMVGKQSTERNEAVHETVRKTEVEVEQIAGNTGDLRTEDTQKNRF